MFFPRLFVYSSPEAARTGLQSALSAPCLFLSVTTEDALVTADAVEVQIPRPPTQPYLPVALRFGNQYAWWGLFATAAMAFPSVSLYRSHGVHPSALRSHVDRVPFYPSPASGSHNAAFLLADRFDAYRHCAISCELESDAPSVRFPATPLDRDADAFAYLLMTYTVARNPDTLEAFVRGERALALHRLSYHHKGLGMLSMLPGAEVHDSCIGLPWEDHPALMRTYGYTVGTLKDGLLFLPPPLWTAYALLQADLRHKQAVETMFRRLTTNPLPVGIDLVVATVASWLRRWELPVIPTATVVPKAVVAAPIVPVGDIEDLHKVMPACMRTLAAEAFDPTVPTHLLQDERLLFYAYALSNQVDPVQLQGALTAKFDGMGFPKGDERYARTTIAAGVKSAQAFVQRPNYVGPSCKTVQGKFDKQGRSLCPFAPATARVDCHRNMEALTGRKTEPGARWASSFPLFITQEAKKAL